tara:strand:+ start:1314 stop:1433 length:120 start_codon:yes stop_codon:yes gene_type:complete
LLGGALKAFIYRRAEPLIFYTLSGDMVGIKKPMLEKWSE